MSWRIVIALVLLERVAMAQAPEAQPAPPQAPPPTRATFVSTTSEQWDVTVDGQPVCATPCSGNLYPLQFVTLQSQEPNPILLEVGHLPPGQLVVTGKPMEHGKYAGGIVATTLGGMALATGIALTAVGFGKDRDGMKTAGLITGAVGAATVPFGIYLMVKAVPSYSVRGAAPYVTGTVVGVTGTF